METRNFRKERVGVVTSNKMDKTITVTVKWKEKHPIYGKFVNKTKKYHAHDEKNECGIGDTVRVSLTSDPIEEVKVAKEILKALKLKESGLEFISCPTCGRTQIDLIGIATEVEKRLEAVNKPIKVAVMGCAVNGPGEAREADIGIAGGNGEGLIFKKGKIIKKVKEEHLVEELMKEIENM